MFMWFLLGLLSIIPLLWVFKIVDKSFSRPSTLMVVIMFVLACVLGSVGFLLSVIAAFLFTIGAFLYDEWPFDNRNPNSILNMPFFDLFKRQDKKMQ